MSAKTMLWMSLGAAALGGSAYYLDQNRVAATQPSETGSLFPELTEQLNDVDQLSISSAEGSLEFSRTDAGWALPGKANFPADRIKLGKYLLALEAAQRVERKTAKPERYEQLGLNSEAADATTIHVLAQAADASVVDLWVGNKRSTGAGTAYYVRVEGEEECWVADGDLGASTTLTDWVDTSLVDLARDRIQAVSVEHSDGEAVVVARGADAEADEPMALVNLPQGKVLQNEWVTSRFDNALQALTFTGVDPTPAADFPTEDVAKTTFWTKHGLAVTLETAALESGDLLTRMSAAYDPNGAPKPYSGPQVEVTEDPLNGDPLNESEESAESPPSPETLQAEADAINAKTGGWLYLLPQFKAQALRPRMDELIKDPEPEQLLDSALDDSGLPTDLNSLLDGPTPTEELEAPPTLGEPETAIEEEQSGAGSGETEGSDEAEAAAEAETGAESNGEGGGL